MKIDLNCDMGEIPEAVYDGREEQFMPYLDSVNIACGGHAGDQNMMRLTIVEAQRWKLNIGAHPGYPDRANFGRLAMDMLPEAVEDFVFQQVRSLAKIAAECGAELHHVKPHGALYNSAVNDVALSEAIARGVARWSKNLVLVGLAGSTMIDVFREQGFAAAGEAFADRRYEPDGSLRSRRHPDSLITDPEEASRQVRDIAASGFVTAVDGAKLPVDAQTVCVHGDTPGALAILKAVSAITHG